SSWFDKLTFSWSNNLMRKGSLRQLQHSDLYKLNKSDMPVSVWRRYRRHRKPGRSLAVAVALALAPELLLQFACTTVMRCVNFTGPFFLQRIIRSIELSRNNSSEISSRRLYLDAFGLLFFNLVAALMLVQVRWMGHHNIIRVKGLLVAELSSKTLRRRGKDSRKKQNIGSKNKKKHTQSAASAADDGKVMNLLTADFQAIATSFDVMRNISSMGVALGIGIWYMYQMLGVSAFIGLSLFCIYVPLLKIMFTRLTSQTVKTKALSDERISMIAELIQGIKTVKLFGWGSRFLHKIDKQREHQLEYTWKICLCKIAIGTCAALSPMLIFFVIIASYVAVFGNKLTAEVAFTSISIFLILKTIIENLPTNVNAVIAGYVSLGRIESYLDQPQVQDLEKRVALELGDTLGFECADLEWERAEDTDDSSKPDVKDIDVQFPIGGLSIVAGPTGSGKSSLLSALIGEMTLTRGRVLLPTVDASLSNEGLAISDIAYVAQEAWLRNATIRENILFGEPYNKDRYEQVLRACALKPDLRILKAGDMTEIGERGVTLSGGQKQRVALARAVYSSRRILLIDDCLSAVDAHTGKHILMECLLNRTSLMQGRTCILVTHHVSMCLPFAQFLVVMKDGRISLKGTPAELHTQSTLSRVLADAESAKEMPKEKTATKDRKGKSVEGILESSSDAFSKDGGATEDYLAKAEGLIKIEVWRIYVSACGSKIFWIMLVLLLALWQAMRIAQNYWIKIWVNSNNSNTNRQTAYEPFLSGAYAIDTNTGNRLLSRHHSSIYWLGIYFLIGFMYIFGRAVHEGFIYRASIRAARTLHAHLLQAIMHATPRFFDSTPLGRIVSRFSHDMQVIDGPAIEKIMWGIAHVIEVLCAYTAISMVTPAFVMVAIAITPVYVGYAYYYLNVSRELKRLDSNNMSPLLSLFGELIQGASTIRAFGVKQHYIKEALNRITAHSRSYYMCEAAPRWLSVRAGFASATLSFSCAIFIIMNLDWIDAGLAGFAFANSLAIGDHMYWAISDYNANESNMNAVERVKQYLDIKQEAALESELEYKPPASWPTKGDVQIEDLVAEYVPGVPVLHGISLSVKHGEKVGVVGRTGAGKSTLSLALLRFVEASSGRIMLDGVDISKIGLEDLRRNVTIIPQDPVLFNGTIRFNLDPFNEYPDEIVWDALRRTHLVREHSSHSSSSRMSEIFSSLDAEIKENGQNLSLGQRQLVALARALVRRSRLIIMDEATASVDFDTDDRIQRTIRGYEFANSTLFCIAHRLRTIIDYDRVLVLDKGKVAEFDTPYNLLQSKDGIFRSMCEKSGEYEYLVAASSRRDNNTV
ncbi:P-loop containing nucleoside triphosphate hydrolase protein, partial [Coemansia spiralis]